MYVPEQIKHKLADGGKEISGLNFPISVLKLKCSRFRIGGTQSPNFTQFLFNFVSDLHVFHVKSKLS